MKKIFGFVLTAFLSLQAAAQLNNQTTTAITGVSKERFETALKRKMMVHKVSIMEIKEQTALNLIGKFYGVFDPEVANRMNFTLLMLVDESLLNKREHAVRCEIVTFRDENQLMVYKCKSATSTVQDMIFEGSDIALQ